MGLKPDVKIDYSELQKVWRGVFDSRTILSIYKLMGRGVIKEIYGIIKQGKESNVLVGRSPEGPVAIKVYAIKAANFRRMKIYLAGDPRFKRIKPDRRSIVYAWARKEFKNLERARKAGVKCPKPIAVLNNVLVLRFIGDKRVPAPRLTEFRVKEQEQLAKKILKFMKLLYTKAKLVHGDLSEFNILFWKGGPWLIDFSQSVVRDHPNADELLERDARNICRYFKKIGLKCEWEDVYKEVTGPE